jgi:hypothetical protein
MFSYIAINQYIIVLRYLLPYLRYNGVIVVCSRAVGSNLIRLYSNRNCHDFLRDVPANSGL